jgi:hypothetical protein
MDGGHDARGWVDAAGMVDLWHWMVPAVVRLCCITIIAALVGTCCVCAAGSVAVSVISGVYLFRYRPLFDMPSGAAHCILWFMQSWVAAVKLPRSKAQLFGGTPCRCWRARARAARCQGCPT